MAAPSVKTVIMIAVSLMVVAIIIPMAIGLISVADEIGFNYTDSSGTEQRTNLSSAADPSVVTILTVLLPIVAIIGILLYYVPSKG